jgi:hypothetical protein
MIRSCGFDEENYYRVLFTRKNSCGESEKL